MDRYIIGSAIATIAVILFNMPNPTPEMAIYLTKSFETMIINH
jgi:hypothetical protein